MAIPSYCFGDKPKLKLASFLVHSVLVALRAVLFDL